MVGSGYRTPPSLVRRSDGQTLQLTPLLYRVLEAIDGRRTCAEIATVVSHSMRRSVSEDMVATLVDQHLRPMGLLKLARRVRASAQAVQPAAGAEAQVRRHQPPGDAATDRPVPVPLPASAGQHRGPRLPGDHLVGLLRPGPRPGGVRRLPAAAAAAARVRGDGALRGLPRVRARGGRALQRSQPRSDRGRHLPGVAGVLHRRDRQLPAGTAGTPSHRPGRPVLQRHRGGAHLRLVVHHAVGRTAAPGGDPGHADGASADAVAALRRLPRARRPDRRTRPVPPDQAHPARTAAAPVVPIPTTGS